MNEIAQKTTPSLEDYLEAIVMLEEQDKKITVTALSKSIGVTKPSVNWALKKLVDAGLILHKRYGAITLTPEGMRIAESIYQRHKTIRQFLTDILNVDPETADNDACQMEHVLSRESLSQLTKFIDFILKYPHRSPKWLKSFHHYIEHG